MVDELDRRIIAELQSDARQTDVQISRMLGASETSVRRRITRLVREGVIRIVAMPNPWKLGLTTTAALGIKAEPIRVIQVAESLAALDMIHAVAVTAGPLDILAWTSQRSLGDLADFVSGKVSAVPGIVSTETMIVLDMKKRDTKILDDLPRGVKPHGAGKQASPLPGSPLKGHALDEQDYRILAELQEDAHRTDAAISRSLGLKEAMVRKRVRRLLREGIARPAAIIDPARVGYTVQVHLGIQVIPSELERVMVGLAATPRVHTLGLTSGRYDVFCWATFRSNAELAQFILKQVSKIPGITKTETLVTMRVVKRDTGLLPMPSNRVMKKEEFALQGAR